MAFATPNSSKMVVRREPHLRIQQTAEKMRDLAWEGQTSPKVRDFALNTLRRVKPKDALSEVAALFYACCKEVHYVGDPIGAEFLQHPDVTIDTSAGDCDDMSILLASVLCTSQLQSVGYPCRFKIVGFNNEQVSHVFLETFIDGSWVALDPVAGSATQEMLNSATSELVFEV